MAGALGNFENGGDGAPNYRESRNHESATQIPEQSTPFSDIINDTTVSAASESALAATPQAYEGPTEFSLEDINPERVDRQVYPETDYIGMSPNADYFGAQGERVVYDKNGNPPAGSYEAVLKAAEKIDVPEELATPKTTWVAPQDVAQEGGTSKRHARRGPRPPVIVSAASLVIALGVVGAEQIVNAAAAVYKLDTEVDQEYFGHDTLLGGASVPHNDCLVDTPYKDGAKHTHGVLLRTDMSVTVDSTEPGQPGLEFKYDRSYIGRDMKPGDDYTQSIADKNHCD